MNGDLLGVEFNQALPLSDLNQSLPLLEDREEKTKQVQQKAFFSKKEGFLVENSNKFNETEVGILSSNKIETLLRSVQYYINDMVLKGTCEFIRLNIPSSSDLTAEYLDLVINTVDIGLGIPNLIQKNRILEESQKTLTKLRKNSETLSPEQLARLTQLEKSINYQKSLIPNLIAEQGLRITRSTLINVRLASIIIPQASFLQVLMAPIDLIIGGINTLISGLFLKQACDHLHLQDLWFKENKEVFSADSISADSILDLKTTFELPTEIHQLQQKRLLSRKTEEEKIKNQIDEQKLTPEERKIKLENHAVIDPLIKGSLVEMVKKKHEIERKFLNFKIAQYTVSLTFSTLIFVTGAVLLLLSLLLTPVGPAALLSLLLTSASIGASAILFGAATFLAHKQKPNLTAASFKGAYIKLIFYYAMHYLQSAKHSIVGYFGEHTVSLLKEKQIETQSWLQKALVLQDELDQMAWQDFAKQTDLKIANQQKNETEGDTTLQALNQTSNPFAFDTLEALNEVLSQCEFNLLRKETRELLEKQLGLDLSTIEEEIKKDPLIIKKMLRNFFNLGNTAFVEFMGKQRGHLS